MGHTNSTANLALPQFIGTDKPTWLGDVNGAFSSIDSKVGTIDADISAVDAKADNAVSDAAAAVTTATNANNTAGTASTTATNALNIANNALTVANNADGHTNQLEMKVGLLADLTTVDKDSIVDAINEVNAKTITVSVSAEDVAYNNTVSGLTATDVQAAIDEIALGGGGTGFITKTVTGDGVKTVSQLLDELHTLISSSINNIKYAALTLGSLTDRFLIINRKLVDRIDLSALNNIGSASFDMDSVAIKASGSFWYEASAGSTYTRTDQSSQVVGAGVEIKLYYMI